MKLTEIHPKIPMRDKNITKKYYINKLGFEQIGTDEFDEYLMVKKDGIEIHFFLFKELNPKENYGQVYIRTDNIDGLYRFFLAAKIAIHTNGSLQKNLGDNENLLF